MNLEEKVENTIDFLVEVSNEFDLPWELGFSSGKDSTTTLALLIEAMRI